MLHLRVSQFNKHWRHLLWEISYLRKIFGYHNPSFLAKKVYKANQAKNEQMKNQGNDMH